MGAAILVLMVLTFIQPAIWLRIVLDLLLLGGLIWAAQPDQAAA